ncbi:MAG: peptide-methionine (S)-S-oxide reductase MsrA [Mycobacteriaceae bacterium]|nr:peptide-methionine (S)-S-oxide reductase MsrA [Mycobacteriaceae bacterium]
MSWFDQFVPGGQAALVSRDKALPGRAEPIRVPETHFVNGHRLQPPWPDGLERAVVAMGCFWGAEKLFWTVPGVYSTAVGYVGGYTPNPSYEEVCTGRTGHTEAVLVVFDPKAVSYAELLRLFWENHDPTQGMRQGHDRGTQYRSALYTVGADQAEAAARSAADYAERLNAAGYGKLTTEIRPLDEPFYYAEPYHQQYLAKNPDGYCPVHATGVTCN